MYKFDLKLVDIIGTTLRIKKRHNTGKDRVLVIKTNKPPELDQLTIESEESEFRGPLNSKASLRADSWSLGCVYSEVTTWLVHDYTRLQDFREARRQVTRKRKTDSPYVGSFHNGWDLLQCVRDHHHLLRQSIRRLDSFTDVVLDAVENLMLVPEPLGRFFGVKLAQEVNERWKNAYTASIPAPLLPGKDGPTRDNTSQPVKDYDLTKKGLENENWSSTRNDTMSADIDTRQAPVQSNSTQETPYSQQYRAQGNQSSQSSVQTSRPESLFPYMKIHELEDWVVRMKQTSVFRRSQKSRAGDSFRYRHLMEGLEKREFVGHTGLQLPTN